VQRLLLPCAIGFESLARFIRDQSDRQLVFGLEGVEGGDRIGRNADDLGSEPGESPLSREKSRASLVQPVVSARG